MNKRLLYSSCSCCSSTCKPKDTLESLQTELNSIKRDISTVKQMKISDEAKVFPLLELENKIKEVKQKMHKLVDEM